MKKVYGSMDNLNKELNIFQRNAKKFVIVATVAGSSSAIFIRLIQTNQIAMGFYRMGFSVPLFAIPIVLGGYKDYKAFTRKDYALCFLAGFFLFCHFFCWFTAVQNTSIASAAVLGSLHPLVVLFVTTVFMKQKVSAKAVIGILIALTGGAIIAGVNSIEGNTLMGDAAGFLAAVFFGSYFLVGRAMRVKVPTVNYIFLVFSTCFVFFAIAMFLTKTPFTGYRPEDYLLIFAMMLVCQGMAHALYNWCIGYVPPLYVSVFATIDCVFAATHGVIFFQEIPTLMQFTGAAIAITGLLYYNYNNNQREIESY